MLAAPPPLLTLVSLCGSELRSRLGIRAAAVMGWIVAAGFGTMLLIGGAHAAPPLTAQAVAWLSWISGGLAALGTARDQAADGLRDLVLQRGHHSRWLEAARLLATVGAIARVTGAPALALALLGVAVSSSGAALARSSMLGAGVLGYVIVFSAALGTLVRVLAALSPRHARSFLVALVLLPEILQGISVGVPSLLDLLRLVWQASVAT